MGPIDILDFDARVKELAKGRLCAASVQVTHFTDDKAEITFGGFIEDTPWIKEPSAQAALDKMAASLRASEACGESGTPLGVSIFKRQYKTAPQLDVVLKRANSATDLANLYYTNAELVESDPPLKQRFTDAKNRVISVKKFAA